MDAKTLQSSIRNIGKQMVVGGAMIAGGLAIAAMFKAPLDEAMKYQNALTRFKQMNLGGAINNDADSMARHANAFGTSATEMMDTLRDLHAAFGSYDEAKQFAPTVAALNAANKSIYGEGHGVDEGETKALAKVIEMRGGTVNPAAFNREMDLMQRMKNATGGVLDSKMLRAYMSTAGVAGRSLSDTGLANMSGLIVEMGGQRAGTATMSMYQNLVGGRTNKKAMAEIASLGLGTLSEVQAGHVGSAKQTTQTLAGIKGEDQLKADPVGWIQNVLLPQFRSKGITDQSTILKTINDIMTNRTGASMASISATQLSVMLKDAKNTANAHDVNATIADAKKTMQGQMVDLSAKWANVMLELGVTVLPMAISAVQHIIPVLQSMSTFVQNNQKAVKLFAGALLGLSAFLIGGGLINVLVGAGRGFGLLYTVLGKWPGILNTTLECAYRAGEVALWVGAKALSLMGAGIRLLGMAIMTVGRALLMNPIGLTLTAIGVAAYFIWKNWGTILPRLKAVWTGITDFIVGAWNHIKSIFGMGDGAPVSGAPPRGGLPSMQTHVALHIDGKQVAQATARHLGNSSSAPTSGSRHDGGLSQPLPSTFP